MIRVLIIEDEPALAQGLADNLGFEGYEASIASTGEEGLETLSRESFQLLLLDLMLPGISGFDVLRKIAMPSFKVIVLSARDGETDIVRALDLGAHDYVRKPFSLSELMARIKVQLRDGKSTPEGEEVGFADVRVSFKRFRLWKGDQEHLLSHTEAELLRVFMAEPDVPLKRVDLLAKVWGEDVYPTERTVDNFILKLRRKIEQDPAKPQFLLTVHGVGYRFCAPGFSRRSR